MSDEHEVYEEVSDELGIRVIDPNTGQQRWLAFRLTRDHLADVAGPSYVVLDGHLWIGTDDLTQVIGILSQLQSMARGRPGRQAPPSEGDGEDAP